MRTIFYPNQVSKEWLYSVSRDHDFPRRVYTNRREAKSCRACGNKFVSTNGLSRYCPVCSKHRQERQRKRESEISDGKGA